MNEEKVKLEIISDDTSEIFVMNGGEFIQGLYNTGWFKKQFLSCWLEP